MTTLPVPFRRLFGYDPEDIALGPFVDWRGRRIDRSDAPSGNRHRSYSLNPSVVESEMAVRARRRYGRIDLAPEISPEERRYGIPDGTHFHLSAQNSRRAIAADFARIHAIVCPCGATTEEEHDTRDAE